MKMAQKKIDYLALKVFTNEDQRVEQRLGGRQLYLGRRLLFSRPMNHSSQDLVGTDAQDIRVLNVDERTSRPTREKARTIDSQMYPMELSVAILKGVLAALFTKPSKISISSGHCPCGSSTVAMAATHWAATPPAF